MEALARLLDAVFLELALPDDDDVPSLTLELFLDAFVAGLVARELRLPELHVALGLARVLAALVRVPKTAINEQSEFPTRVRDVGMSCALLPVTAVPRPAHLAQHLAHDEFRLGVDALVRDHDVMHCLAYHAFHDTARTCAVMSQVRGTMGTLFAHLARKAGHV